MVPTEIWKSKWSEIALERKTVLHHITETILRSLHEIGQANVVFVCTHNSRRSQIAETVFRELAAYFELTNIRSYSAGTEATACYPTVINALSSFGMDITKIDAQPNQRYLHKVKALASATIYSKTIADESLASMPKIAIMVCNDADANCPIVSGARARIALAYVDPKAYDGTQQEENGYIDKVHEIGTELSYLSHLVSQWKDTELRPIDEGDYPQLRSIYEAGIDTGIATFETKATNWEAWDNSHLNHSRWAIWKENFMIGWVALSKVSDRCVYDGVAELSVYVDHDYRGLGLGSRLIHAAIFSSEQNDIWTIQSGIMRDNQASIQLHKSVGFREIGYRERVGKLNGVWKDNMLLERRSNTVGK